MLRVIKKDERLAAIPFIFYSAVYTGDEDRELALSLGADAFLVKPMEPEPLWQRLQEILERCLHKGSALPQLSATEEDQYYQRYSRVVATKLEEKVRELESELGRRMELEVEREKIISELTLANRDLNNLTEVVSDSFSTLNLDDMLHLFLTRIVKVLDASSASVYLLYGEHLRIRASIGMEESVARRVSVKLNEGIPGIIVSTGKPLYVGNVSTDRHVLNIDLKNSGIVSVFGVPIFHNQEVLGTVQIGWNERHPESEREKTLLTVTAERCGNAISNCSLFERTEKMRKYLNLQIQKMPIAHIVWDQKFSVQSWNPAATRIFGYSAEETIGRHPFDLIIPERNQSEMQETWEKLLADTSDTGAQQIIENTTRDGRTIICEWHNIPLRKADGSLRGALSMVLDITDRQQSEQKLRQAKEEWERTFNTIPEAITIQDKDYRIIRCNTATCQLLGLTSDDIIGHICHERLWGQSEHCPGCPALQTFSDSQTHQTEIFQEDIHKTFLVSTTPLFDVTGQLENIIHVAKDITELKETEERYRHAQKMEAIGTLAGGIAHDFNNILSGIIGYAEFVQRDIQNSGKSTEDIDQVLQAGKRAAELVRQILTFSRQTEQKRQPLRLQYIVKEVLKLLRPSLPTTVEIRQNIDVECREVLADTSQIHQLVMNLCTNAYQAMGNKGGILQISLEQKSIAKGELSLQKKMVVGDYVVLTISDTGCGIDKITREKIFDPYFTTKKSSGGTGLGLAVVHGIVSESGGHISVYSELNKGTVFKVYFPAIQKEPVELPEQTLGEQSLPTGTERLLLVDDERTIVEINKRHLKSLGYQATAVSDSMEALDIFSKHPEEFDLVITDLAMPKMDGIELSRKILVQRIDIPIILCSGYSELTKREEAKDAGILVFIEKPLLKDELALAVRNTLDSRKTKMGTK